MDQVLRILDGLGAGGLVKSVGDVVGRFVTTDKDRLEAERALSDAALAHQAKVLEAQGLLAQHQAEVIRAEATSQSWLASNWRPLLMLTFTYIVAHNYVVAPLLAAFAPSLPPASLPIPDEMWSLLKLGMTGYIAGRTIEKVAPQLAEIAAAGRGK